MLIYIFLFLNELFPAFNNLIGIQYNGIINRILIASTSIYVMFLIIIYILKNRFLKNYFYILLFLLIVAMGIFVSFNYYGNVSATVEVYLFNFIVRIIPAVGIIPLLISRPVTWHISKIKVIFIFLALSIFKFIVGNLNSSYTSVLLDFGGVNYNDYGYICALTLLLGLILLDFTWEKSETSKTFKIINISFIIVSIIGLFASSGRGAIITGIVFLAMYILKIVSNINITRNKVILIILTLIFIVSVMYIFRDNAIINSGLQRAFSFLDFGGSPGIINWEETSSRGLIYAESLSLINERLLTGYGLGAFFVILPTAIFSHNIFLDILVEGGVIYLLLWLFIITYAAYISIKNRGNFFNDISSLLFLFSFIKLLSGSTIYGEIFYWVGLASVFIINKNIKSNKIPRKLE